MNRHFYHYNFISAKSFIVLLLVLVGSKGYSQLDGSIDTNFNVGNGFDFNVYDIELQNDGKILVGGGFTKYNFIEYNKIIRLETDGSIDASFDPGEGGNHNVKAIAVQSDGKIVVGGFFTQFDGTFANRIVRLNSDGSIDNTF